MQRFGDSRPNAAASGGPTGRSLLLVEAFQFLVNELGAFHGVVYLAQSKRSQLFSAVVGGAPPSVFTVPEWVSYDSDSSPAVAYRTARVVSRPDPCSSEYSDRDSPPLMPYPHYVVSVPLTDAGETYGVLTGQWAPAFPSDRLWVLERMEELGRRLSSELVDCQPADLGASFMQTPIIIPVLSNPPPRHDATENPWGLNDAPGSSALSMMYQVHKLSAAFNEAFQLDDVMRATRDRIMVPFRAHAFLVAIVQEGRVQIVGRHEAAAAAREIHGSSIEDDFTGSDTLRTRAPIFIPDTKTLAQYSCALMSDSAAAAIVPFNASGGLKGFLLLGFGTPRRIEAEEQAVLMMMAAQLATAVERAHLHERKHALADVLQQKLLPRTLPDFPEVTLAARYLPAESAGTGLGGDWYDVVPLPGSQVGLIVGDVEGHNVNSAAIMGQLRSGCRAYAAEGHRPTDVLARASDLLAELDTDLYATCCFVRVDPESDVCEIALAGHPPPVLRCPDAGVVVPPTRANIPLAVTSGYAYSSTEVTIRPGTLLMLYTDGILFDVDPVSDARTLLEAAGTADHHSLHALTDLMVSHVANGRRNIDDLALLLALYEGGDTHGEFSRVARMSIRKRDIRSVKSARKFVRNYLLDRDRSDIVGDAEVIVSEVITNGLIHADSDVELRLRGYPDRIHIEVQDTNARPPVPTSFIESEEENSVAEHGRGLGIVENLSSDWGTSPHGRGKTVWIDLSFTGAK
jgi:anti-sigma regulatory factor (Ser/Thr protein kinase)